jgi:chromosome segregation ATPase
MVRKKIEEHIDMISDLEEKTLVSQQHSKTLEKQLKEAEKMITALSEENQRIKQHGDQLLQATQVEKTEKTQLESEFALLSVQFSEQASQLKKSEEEIGREREEKAKLKDLLSASQAESEYKALQLTEAKRLIEQLQSKLAANQTALEQAGEEKVRLAAQFSEQASQLKKSEEEIGREREEKAKLKDLLSASQAESESKASQLTEAKRLIEQLQSSQIAATEKWKEAEQRLIAESTSKISALDSHIKQLSGQILALKEQLSELSLDEVNRIKRENERLLKEKEADQEEIRQLTAVNNELIGHSNIKQKIKHHSRIKEENQQLKVPSFFSSSLLCFFFADFLL